jgi:hypothetical protein
MDRPQIRPAALLPEAQWRSVRDVRHLSRSVLGVGQAVELADDDRRAVLAADRLGPCPDAGAITFAVPLLQLTGQWTCLAASNWSNAAGAAAFPADVGAVPMSDPIERSNP